MLYMTGANTTQTHIPRAVGWAWYRIAWSAWTAFRCIIGTEMSHIFWLCYLPGAWV